MILDGTVDGRAVRVEVREGPGGYIVVLDGVTRTVEARTLGRSLLSLIVEGESHLAAVQRRPGGYTVHLREDTVDVELGEAPREGTVPVRKGAGGPLRITAPMPGRVVRVLVEPGEEVLRGQGVVVMEAMKMENELRAPRPGRVAEVHARERQAVEMGALLVVLD